MATVPVYFKRTSVSGRTPNTTASYATNTQYIAAGEMALNLADQKAFISNGTIYYEVGSNLINLTVTGNTIHAGNTYLNANLYVNTGVNIIDSTGVIGTAGQVLTTNGAGNVYWSTVSGGGGGGSVNTAAVYNFTNTISFGNSTSNTTITNSSVTTVNGYIQAQFISTSVQTGTSYTFANTDSGTIIQTTNVAAVTLTVPSTFPANSRVLVTQMGTGVVTIANAAGISLGSRTGAYNVGNQYGTISVYMVNSTFAVIDGNLSNTSLVVNTAQQYTFSNTITFGNSSVNTTIGYNVTDLSVLESVGNWNNFMEHGIYNTNTGGSASGDFIVNDDHGTGPTNNNYIDFGINSSGWSNTLWTINGPSDGYLYMGNNGLSIGVAGPDIVNFFANGTLANNEIMRISANGVSINNSNPSNAYALNVTGITNHQGTVVFSNGIPGQIFAISSGFALI